MRKTSQPFSLPPFLREALAEKRVVHLCVDNQAYYPSRDLHDDKLIAGTKILENIADITNQLSEHIPTIHVNYAIGDDNFEKFANHSYFSMHQHNVFCDEKNMRTYPERQGYYTKPVKLDFINHAFIKDYCFIKEHCSAFNDGRLDKFLSENGWNVPLFSGAYLTSCIKASLEDCMTTRRYAPVLLSDCVMDYDDGVCAAETMRAYHQELTESKAFQWGLPTIESGTLINHLKIR